MKKMNSKRLSQLLLLVALMGAGACGHKETTETQSDNDTNNTTMTYDQIVHERFSCKQFNPEKQVDSTALRNILEAGRVAPTARNLQEQRIYVISDAETLQKIDSVTPCRYGAPTVVVVAYDVRDVYTYPKSDRNSGVEDATIVATHMLLATTANGVNSCWVNCFNPSEMEQLLNLPEYQKVVMMMDLGYAEEGAGPLANHANRKALEETVTFGIHK